MKIQTLSVAVPGGNRCINQCETCPSRMHEDPYNLLINPQSDDFGKYVTEYIKRLEFARHNGCNTLMLTGNCEPQQNRTFLAIFGMMLKLMKDPFQWIEIQTTGTTIDRGYLQFLRDHVGVSLVALSTFALDQELNESIIHPPKGYGINTLELASDIKEFDMSLRMCLNLTSYFDQFVADPDRLFDQIKGVYNADQVTLRVLYESGNDLPEDKYVRENSAKPETVQAFKDYIRANGKLLGTLPYGAKKYSVHGMSTVLDDDSMGKSQDKREGGEDYKYLILRPDCKLYSEWDDPASLIF